VFTDYHYYNLCAIYIFYRLSYVIATKTCSDYWVRKLINQGVYNNFNWFSRFLQDGVTGARRGSGRTTAGHEDAVPQPPSTPRFRITTAHHLHKSRRAHRAPLRMSTRDGRDRTTWQYVYLYYYKIMSCPRVFERWGRGLNICIIFICSNIWDNSACII